MAFTKEQLELQAYIEKKNEESRKRADAEGWTIFGVTVSDPAHWAESDITSIEEYKYDEAASTYSDFYKEVNGFRPRGENMTLPEIEHEIDRLHDQVLAEEDVKSAYEQSKDDKAVARREANRDLPNTPLSGLGAMLK
jgi:hypothetical protein